MAASGYSAKIKNFRNAIFYIPFEPKFYTDHFLRKKHTENYQVKGYLHKTVQLDHFFFIS